jgi:hypothetical protein
MTLPTTASRPMLSVVPPREPTSISLGVINFQKGLVDDAANFEDLVPREAELNTLGGAGAGTTLGAALARGNGEDGAVEDRQIAPAALGLIGTEVNALVRLALGIGVVDDGGAAAGWTFVHAHRERAAAVIAAGMARAAVDGASTVVGRGIGIEKLVLSVGEDGADVAPHGVGVDSVAHGGEDE